MNEQPKQPWYKKWWAITLIAIGALIIISIIINPNATKKGFDDGYNNAAPKKTRSVKKVVPKKEIKPIVETKPATETPAAAEPTQYEKSIYNEVFAELDSSRNPATAPTPTGLNEEAFKQWTIDLATKSDAFEKKTITEIAAKNNISYEKVKAILLKVSTWQLKIGDMSRPVK